MPVSTAPRIALVHALRESIEPTQAAFVSGWPQASTFNLLDESLSAAVAQAGGVSPRIIERFLMLGRYAAGAGVGAKATDGLLFTCSAFGTAIDAVERELHIPVIKPTDAAFQQAVNRGGRIGLLVTFGPSLAALTGELERCGRTRNRPLSIDARLVEGALDALQGGDAAGHDARIAAAAASLRDCEVIVLGQFSMARARAAMSPSLQERVLTTPDAAVAELRRRVLKDDSLR